MNSANTTLALSLLIQLAEQVQKVGLLVSNAQAEGRDISVSELDFLKTQDDLARKSLEDAIASAVKAASDQP